MEILAKKEVSFRTPDETVQGMETFRYAMEFFKCSGAQGKTFEVTLDKDCVTAILEDMTGALVPDRFQFDISGSTINVRAKYRPFFEAEQGFALEVRIDLFGAMMAQPRLYFAPVTIKDREGREISSKVMFYAEDQIVLFKAEMKKGISLFGDDQSMRLLDSGRQAELQATAAWLMEFMVNFLVDNPGVTNGPNANASAEERLDFVKAKIRSWTKSETC